MKGLITIAAAMAALSGTPAHAQGATGRLAQPAEPSAAAPATAMSEAEVRKVDKGSGKITLKHGPIPNIEMPPMTMVFLVSDPAMLDRVKAGDKVRFTADKVGGQYTVTRIEPAK